MSLIDEINEITNRLVELTGKIDAIEFKSRRYQQEIKYVLTLKPELEDLFSDATKKEAGIDIH